MFGRKRTLMVVSLLATGACYTYHPVRPADAVLDTRVRATVSAEQAAELAPIMRNVTPTVMGRLVERGEGNLLLEVPMYGATAGMSSGPLRNRVTIPLSEVVTLESRTFSKWRTGLVLGAVAAAVGGTWIAVSGEDLIEDKGKPGTDNSPITIFRIPLGGFR